MKAKKEQKLFAERLLSYALYLAGNVETLAHILGVSVPTIYAWRNGRRKPGRENINKLEAYLRESKKTMHTIVPRSSSLCVSEKNQFLEEYDRIELFDHNLYPTSELYAFRKTWVDKFVPRKDLMNLFLYRVDTELMKPAIYDGSMVLINTNEKRLLSGKLYLLLFSTTLCIRRFFDTPTQYTFRVDNREFSYQDICVEKEATHNTPNYEVIGRIIWCANTL